MSARKQRFDIEPADSFLNGHCDWPDCEEKGEHRAPRSRQELKSYRWFCLEHVRVYNKSWNYYADMSEDEVEADVRKDTVWQRPSWPLGATNLAEAFESALGDFGIGEGPRQGRDMPLRPQTPQEKAMAELELLPPVTPHVVKARYKELVKRYHPDANGGAKASEEKFKQITQAYETVMADLGS